MRSRSRWNSSSIGHQHWTLSLLLLASAGILVIASDQPGASDPDLIVQRAVESRAKQGLSWKEQQKVVELLITAAGIRLTGVHALPGLPHVQLSDEQSQPGKQISGFSEITIAYNAHPGALREVAKALQDGWGCDMNMRLALELFRHASDIGDAEAQGQMAMRYALGLHEQSSWDIHGIVGFGEPDEAAAMLHYYYAALGGDSFSRMALGYRHMYGIGVPKACWTAAAYYQPVAEETADKSIQSGMLPQIERIRLSVQSNQGLKADRHKELVQYYQYSADRGNVDAQTAVGQVLNYGTHGVQRDHAQALHYLQQAASAGDVDAMAHLGHMHANGFGTLQDFVTAVRWFKAAAKHGNPSALYGLGYMYLTGQGVVEDHDKAYKYFSQATDQGHPDAHFYMGVMHLKGLGVKRKSVQRAFSYFTLASHAGHLLAMYNTAAMHLAGKGTVRSCKPACLMLKQLSERGPAAAALQLGHEHFFKSQYSQALLHYLAAAEMGMELGQSNAAWMLAHGYIKRGGALANVTSNLFRRSADQGNIASLLALGDAYFYGDGVGQDWVRSAAIYYDAFQERSAEAMFNLGFMHQFGAGVPQDLQLAQRFYHMAKHTQPDSALPVYIATAGLKLHEAWDVVRPYLPSQLDHVWDQVFVLRPPHTSLFGPWAHVLHSWMPTKAILQGEVWFWRWVDALGLGGVLGWGDAKEFGETATLVFLVFVLYVVLKIRQQRMAQQRLTAAGAAAAAAAGVPAAGPHQAPPTPAAEEAAEPAAGNAGGN